MRPPALWLTMAAAVAASCATATAPTPSAEVDRAPPTPTVVVERDPPEVPEPEPVETPVAAAMTPTPIAADGPNIVVFLTDDQTVDQMEIMAQTRTLLADRGVTFTQSFVNVPLCCPSRATLLTGQHASTHGVLTNAGASGGFATFADQEHTLATGLEQAGYQTLFVGRYLNGYGLTSRLRVVPPGWTDFHALVAPSDTLYVEPTVFDNGELVSYGEDDYSTDLITERALAGIERALGSGGPIFALVGYPAPHSQAGLSVEGYSIFTFERDIADRFPGGPHPALPAPRHRGTLADHPVPLRPSFDEDDVSDKPAFLQRRPMAPGARQEVEDYYRAGLESLLSVDESIAAIVDRFERSDVGDTYFIFTSDNGVLHGEHRIFGFKYLPYEETVRVPLIVSGPDVATDEMVSAVVSNVDLAPTIFELAGVEPNRPSEGRSLLGLMTGAEEQWGRAVLLEGFEFRPGSPPYRGVHTGESVYIEWLTGETELYDLVADPYQLDNLADRPAAADLLARNQTLLRRFDACTGAACGLVGAELAPAAPPAR